MKLYFYILNRRIETDKFKLRVEECEVVEKPKTYKPADKFPHGVWNSFIKKESIGHFIDGFLDIVVLDKPDYEKAKEVFMLKYNSIIRGAQATISKTEEMVAAVENFKEETKC